ncbi:4ba4a0ed-83ef-4266-b66a-21246ae65287 [Sclerotinia trifoliorum]|uniref:4ba4a0ed-83ef-4266-b66a-21246ae65287 n=1 Tax=Sclerotinia trifoliorum TaxID=28548 RepID=A0A8H2W1W1_9HELO|nr:4ba4a0ed-83ef-4266-b66a-21246ae65287 [Sclerotinia trifoliorum]
MESQADPRDPPANPGEDYLFNLDMSCDLMSEWDIQQAREKPVAVIGVKDAQLSAPVGANAWGWNGVMAECPIQPILVSVSVALRRAFKMASEDDDITEDTIHYGRIRSAILETVHRYNTKLKPDNAAELSIKNIVTHLIGALTIRHHLTVGKNVNWSSVKVMLPKSSLHGAGTSLTMQTIYREEILEDQELGSPESIGVMGRSLSLRIHDLTVPTLIGMLEKERFRKQNVIVNVEVDRWLWYGDSHWDMEQIIVKAMEESSFQTLEALAEHIGKLLTRYVLIPKIIGAVSTASSEAAKTWESFSDDYKKVPWEETDVKDFCSIVNIKLEKPGIYMDTIPGVEMSMDIQPQSNSPYFYLWEDYEKLKIPERSYNGTLKDWIAENYPDEPLAYRKRKLEASETEPAKSRKTTEEVNSHPSSPNPTAS